LELKTCVKCGTASTVRACSKRQDIEGVDHFGVVCPECGFEGPIYLDEETAMVMWNHIYVVGTASSSGVNCSPFPPPPPSPIFPFPIHSPFPPPQVEMAQITYQRRQGRQICKT
jgi:hypothetical protein